MYRIFRVKSGVLLEANGKYYLNESIRDWNLFINDDNLYQSVGNILAQTSAIENPARLNIDPLPPIDKQEIWAAGVTYFKSREARNEESTHAEGISFYDKVYTAGRPELFFKASAARTVGSGQGINIRKDSTWNVPEPELTLFITSGGNIVGYTIGNDMSSRSIEGENPLYLPQAKIFEKCAALGPCIVVSDKPISTNTTIVMQIERNGELVFNDWTSINQMKRKHKELVSYLYRECVFPYGAFLMTGTGMIPPKEFTLNSGDIINISIEPIGTLTNKVI
jgi:2-dehydro-3-deoxy-D-arabinonate dehydratase